MKTACLSLMIATLWWCAPDTRADEIVVVVNPANPNGPLQRDDVVRFYMGKADAFEDQSPVQPVGLKSGDPVRGDFEAQVLRKESLQLRAYWSRMVFSGRGTPPRELETVAELKAWVATHPHAIGYLRPADLDDSVRVVLRVPE